MATQLLIRAGINIWTDAVSSPRLRVFNIRYLTRIEAQVARIRPCWCRAAAPRAAATPAHGYLHLGATCRVPLTRSARPRSPLTSRSRAAPCPAVPPPLPCGAHAAAARRCVRGRPRRAQPTTPLPEHPRLSPGTAAPGPGPPKSRHVGKGMHRPPRGTTAPPSAVPIWLPRYPPDSPSPRSAPLTGRCGTGRAAPGREHGRGYEHCPTAAAPLLKGRQHRCTGTGTAGRDSALAQSPAGPETWAPCVPRVCLVFVPCAPRVPPPRIPVPRIPIQPPLSLHSAWCDEAVSRTAPPGGSVGDVTHC